MGLLAIAANIPVRPLPAARMLGLAVGAIAPAVIVVAVRPSPAAAGVVARAARILRVAAVAAVAVMVVAALPIAAVIDVILELLGQGQADERRECRVRRGRQVAAIARPIPARSIAILRRRGQVARRGRNFAIA